MTTQEAEGQSLLFVPVFDKSSAVSTVWVLSEETEMRSRGILELT